MIRSSLVAFAVCLRFAQAGPAPDYLGVVRAYADAIVEHGRDVYGSAKSPLFASTLDRKTLRIPENPPGEIPGIRNGDRSLFGANPMHDENLYQVLYALTEITGDRRYAAGADDALRWFFEHCQSPATGLLAWGEHLSWDFFVEGTGPDRNVHEFFRPWVLWDKSLQLAPEAVNRFALGLWNHQVSDQGTGAFSRHARYSEHGPSKGREFSRHGGFYIATWAASYRRSKNPELLRAIELLLASFERRRNEKSGAIPSGEGYPELMWSPSNLSFAIDLWDSSGKVPRALGKKMRASAAKTDTVFLRMKHDLTPDGRGFIKTAYTSTLEAGDIREKLQNRSKPAWYPYTRIWSTGYGLPTDAQVAMHCLLRYEQVKIAGYKKLFLETAERYLSSGPDTSIALYPGALANPISVLAGAYRLTGDRKYLERADAFGRKSVEMFFDGSPLPRATTQHDHYETITQGDSLVMALLDLWVSKNRRNLKSQLTWSDR